MMRAALYHRVSTLDQDPGLARIELVRAAAARGFEIALEVEETGSGARNDRPGLRRILDAVSTGAVGAVLVWKLDRWGRSAMDVLSNIRLLEASGCEFHAVTQGLSIVPRGEAVSRLILTVLAAVAEFERALIQERTRLGLARAVARGARPGRPKGRWRKGEALRVVPVAEARRLREAGYSWSQIAAALKVSASAVRRALAGMGG